MNKLKKKTLTVQIFMVGTCKEFTFSFLAMVRSLHNKPAHNLAWLLVLLAQYHDYSEGMFFIRVGKSHQR